jgi:MYXO-CTERM domain-containing protein
MAATTASRPARACGGFFCDNVQPVVQEGERILFVVDRANERIDVVVNIQYQGDTSEFAWILPLSAPPTDVRVVPSRVFGVFDQQTAPQFRATFEREGACVGDRNVILAGAADEALGNGSGNGGDPFNPVNVLQRDNVGPYETVVLDAPSGAEAAEWLTENGYGVPPGSDQLLTTYLMRGDVLLALRLRNQVGVNDVQPIWITMPTAEPCVPLRLTQVAALDDMGVTTLVLADERAIPENFFHLEINLARIDWMRGGQNYPDLVAEAADEAAGHAFLTEFAGDAAPVVGATRSFVNDGLRGQLERMDQSADFVNAVRSSQLALYPETVPILQALLPAGLVDQFGRPTGNEPIDPAPIAAALWDRIVEPENELFEVMQTQRYLTRMFTRISPEEMTLDPIMSFRADLPDVSNLHRARIVEQCGFGGRAGDLPARVEIEETGQIYELSADELRSGDPLPSLPAATIVEQLEERRVVDDRRDEIEEALATAGSTCQGAGSAPAAWLVLAGALGLVTRRRRRAA